MSEWEAIADLSRLAPPAGTRREPTMKEAVGEFEAYFIGEMLRIGAKSSSENSLLDGDQAGRMYKEMLFEELGRITSKQRALGLVQSLAAEGPAQTEAKETRDESSR